jgi:ABC-2 type transport system permease protein
MRFLARALPPSYVFENLRAMVSGGRPSGAALAGSALLAGADIALACWLFGRVFRYTVRTGLLAATARNRWDKSSVTRRQTR